jgi:hypothetical protein
MSIALDERTTIAAPDRVSDTQAPPRIVANRRQVENRFPVLAFTVQTGARPFYEVILTTDPSLFDPANAERRTSATFYSSRQDGGLSRASGPEAVYIVPGAVMRAFAEAEPKARAIYFTAATYSAADGSRPLFAQPLETLGSSAPSVSLAEGFTGHTLAAVLGIPAHKLQRWHGPIAVEEVAAPPPVVTPEQDRGSEVGEDGFEMLGRQAPEPVAEAPVAAPSLPAGAPPAPEVASPVKAADIDYFDGYEEMAGDLRNVDPWVWGAAARMEPAALEDEEELHAAEEEGGDAWGTLAEGAPAAAPADEEEGVGAYYALDDSVAEGPPPPAEAPPPPAEPPSLPAEPPALAPLEIEDKRRIIERIAQTESGAHRYGAINADGEFKGRFGPEHPAYQAYHIGLSYGIIQFAQDGGALGQLLTMMRERDPQAFAEIFGPHADELVTVATAPGPSSRDVPEGRSARVQPVGGSDIWEGDWPDRFRRAGDHVPFQAAQNELAATNYLEPMLQYAGWLGLNTDRALTMVVDRAVQMGVNGARQWIIGAVGPITTPALRQQALASLGHADLRAFQEATPGLEPDNLWGPMTHAALVAALRGLGPASPIPVPTLDQMLDAMVRHAQGELWANRVERLRTATDFSDVAYQP